MWHKLGIEFFSTGYYSAGDKPGDLPHIPITKDKNLPILFRKCKAKVYGSDKLSTPNGIKSKTWCGFIPNNQFTFTRYFIDQFDCILFNHFANNIMANLPLLRDKKVILKTYGMHNPSEENLIKMVREKHGVKVIRNSPNEYLRFADPKRYAGHDAIIRGSVVKDEHELSGWTGEVPKVSTFCSYMFRPNVVKRQKLYQETVKLCDNPCEVYGVGNEPHGKFISHEAKVKILQSYRANLVCGTPQSNCTYSFVEAFVMGQPMVIFGKDMWQSDSYEAGSFIKQGENGFVGETPKECAEYLNILLSDKALAQKISIQSRQDAIKVYGRDVLAEQWRTFFTSLGLTP
jgi:hypothetical protein